MTPNGRLEKRKFGFAFRGRFQTSPHETDIVADHRGRIDGKGLGTGDVELLELDPALPNLPQEILEDLNGELLTGAAAVAEGEGRKARMVTHGKRLPVEAADRIASCLNWTAGAPSRHPTCLPQNPHIFTIDRMMPAAASLAHPFRHLRFAAVGGLAVSLVTASTADGAGLIRDAETESLIRSYAKPIFNAAGLGSQAINIHIVNDPAFNAFVIDGHNMFINAGALIKAKTPNQIIGVIAHESGHIAGGHLARLRSHVSRAKSAALMLHILSLAAVTAGAAVGAGNIGHVGIGRAYGGSDAAMRMVLAYRQDEESSADQAAITFLNATQQSARGLLQTLEFMNNRLFEVQGINPYLQSHPLPSQRLAQLRNLAEESPYYENTDPPELQFRHDLVKAKLCGFIEAPQTVFNRYPQSDQSLAANYARAIATYRKSGLRVSLPMLDALILAKPDWPYFYEIEGRALLESGKVDAAIPVLRVAVTLAPNEPLIRIMLARALLGTPDQQNVDDAISNLQTALVRESGSAMGYRQLATAYAAKGAAAEGVSRQQYFAQADLALAEAYFREGRLNLAKQQAKRAKAGLIDGTPNWLRADDILMFEPTTR